MSGVRLKNFFFFLKILDKEFIYIISIMSIIHTNGILTMYSTVTKCNYEEKITDLTHTDSLTG